MSYFHLKATSVVTAPDHQNLMAAWRRLGHYGRSLVGTFVCEKPLTPAQLRRLPRGLREKMGYGEGDSLAWLESLYRLDSGEAA